MARIPLGTALLPATRYPSRTAPYRPIRSDAWGTHFEKRRRDALRSKLLDSIAGTERQSIACRHAGSAPHQAKRSTEGSTNTGTQGVSKACIGHHTLQQ